MPVYSQAKIVVGAECNLGFEAHHIIHTLRSKHVPHIALHEGPHDSPGILTTNESKELMCTALQEMLDFRRIVFSNTFLCLSMDQIKCVKLLERQLRTYTIIVEPPKTAFARSRKTYSGKVGGNQDDLCIALQLAILTYRMFVRHDKYSAHQGRVR